MLLGVYVTKIREVLLKHDNITIWGKKRNMIYWLVTVEVQLSEGRLRGVGL